MIFLKKLFRPLLWLYSALTTWVNTRKEVGSLKEEYLRAIKELEKAQRSEDEFRVDSILANVIYPLNEKRAGVICLPGITQKNYVLFSELHGILYSLFRDIQELRWLNEERP